MTKPTDHIAQEMSYIIPTFLRHMFPFVFGPMKMPPQQVLAIVCVEEKGQCSLGHLAKELHVSAPTVTGIVDRLERDGYMKRIADEHDRRVINVVITPQAKKVANQFRKNIKQRWAYILNSLPPEDREGPLNMLKKISKGFTDGSI